MGVLWKEGAVRQGVVVAWMTCVWSVGWFSSRLLKVEMGTRRKCRVKE